jgi:hypothetical protein
MQPRLQEIIVVKGLKEQLERGKKNYDLLLAQNQTLKKGTEVPVKPEIKAPEIKALTTEEEGMQLQEQFIAAAHAEAIRKQKQVMAEAQTVQKLHALIVTMKTNIEHAVSRVLSRIPFLSRDMDKQLIQFYFQATKHCTQCASRAEIFLRAPHRDVTNDDVSTLRIMASRRNTTMCNLKVCTFSRLPSGRSVIWANRVSTPTGSLQDVWRLQAAPQATHA